MPAHYLKVGRNRILTLAVICPLWLLAQTGCSKLRENPVSSSNLASANLCQSCHGSEANPAPPRDVSGATSTTLVTVGAHQAHLSAVIGVSVTCDECHVVPDSVLTPGHIVDGPAPVRFGPIATSFGVGPRWDRSSETCSSVYCHGATLSGGSNTQPRWTLVDSSQKSCNSCHGFSPPSGKHASVWGPHNYMGTNCTNCHGGTVTDPSGSMIIRREVHINGVVDVQIFGGSWNPATKTCSPGCHGPQQW